MPPGCAEDHSNCVPRVPARHAPGSGVESEAGGCCASRLALVAEGLSADAEEGVSPFSLDRYAFSTRKKAARQQGGLFLWEAAPTEAKPSELSGQRVWPTPGPVKAVFGEIKHPYFSMTCALNSDFGPVSPGFFRRCSTGRRKAVLREPVSPIRGSLPACSAVRGAG